MLRFSTFISLVPAAVLTGLPTAARAEDPPVRVTGGCFSGTDGPIVTGETNQDGQWDLTVRVSPNLQNPGSCEVYISSGKYYPDPFDIGTIKIICAGASNTDIVKVYLQDDSVLNDGSWFTSIADIDVEVTGPSFQGSVIVGISTVGKLGATNFGTPRQHRLLADGFEGILAKGGMKDLDIKTRNRANPYTGSPTYQIGSVTVEAEDPYYSVIRHCTFGNLGNPDGSSGNPRATTQIGALNGGVQFGEYQVANPVFATTQIHSIVAKQVINAYVNSPGVVLGGLRTTLNSSDTSIHGTYLVGTLGLTSDSLGAVNTSGTFSASLISYGTARRFVRCGTFAPTAQLYIRDSLDVPSGQALVVTQSGGLQGNIAIGNFNGTGIWRDDGSVGGAILSPRPAYAQTSPSLGGGAVGQFPYRLHGQDCFPAADNNNPPVILESVFNQSDGTDPLVVLEFYGPIAATSLSGSTVKLVREDLPSGCEEVDYSASLVAVRQAGGTPTNSRRVEIRRATIDGNLAPSIPHGMYRIELNEEDPLIGSTANGPEGAVAAFSYRFEFGRDCNSDGIRDDDQLATLDTNNDGIIDSCQTIGGCGVDFNYDGFVDFFDYSDYVLCYECGVCWLGQTADFNQDGFVDFFDYSDFVAAYELGC